MCRLAGLVHLVLAEELNDSRHRFLFRPDRGRHHVVIAIGRDFRWKMLFPM